MDIPSIFGSKATQLFWRPLPAAQILGAPAPQAFEAGQSYFVVRVTEMYLNSCRKLWKQLYPMIHAYIDVGGTTSQTVAGPGQLTALGDANIDRITNLNQRLLGPTPFPGGDVTLIAGLYSVPSQDSSKVLVDTLSTLAGIALSATGATAAAKLAPLADAVKSGIEGLIGIGQSSLQLGVQCTFGGSAAPLTSGYWVGVGAPQASVDISQLWLQNGRLTKGSTAISATPYSDRDYMVLSIERVDQREDWRTLPVITQYNPQFEKITLDADLSADEKRKRLGSLWPAFQQSLADSNDLTAPDCATVAKTVASELLQRLDSQTTGNPFLTSPA